MPYLHLRAMRPFARFTLMFVVVALAALVAPARLEAQIVMNPHVVSFIPSDDHNATTADGQPAVTGYEFEVFVAGLAQPIAVVSLGKPNPSPDGMIYADFTGLLLSPLQTGVPLEARVAAVGPAGRGESAPSNLFEFDSRPSPTAPNNPAPVPPPSATSVSLSITEPVPHETFKLGDAVTVVARISGRVSGVDFYVNGRSIGTVAASPYSMKWKSDATGKYTFTAITVDANGMQVRSAPVTVMVSRMIVAPRKAPTGAPVVGKAKDRG